VEGVRSASLKPVTGGAEITIPIAESERISYPQWSPDGARLAYFVMTPGRMTMRVFDVAARSARDISATGLAGRLAPADGWSRDNRYFLFTATTDEGRSLWVADISAGTARRLTSPSINYVAGNCSWSAGTPPAVCLLVPEGRGAEPKRGAAPTGPIVQESFGRAAPTRTNTYLLTDSHDEALFDHYFTSQLATVTLDGQVTPLGAAAVHSSPSVSPDGRYLLVRQTHRPYSYQVGMFNFPQKVEVWTLDGRVVRTVDDRPLIEVQPSMRDATSPGIRSISWRPDEPATLVLVRALDDGDPRKEVAKRDRVSLLRAPFSGEPQTFVETEMRYGGIAWLGERTAMLTDFSRQSNRARMWVIDPSQAGGGTPRLLWDFNIEDRVEQPGNLMYTYDATQDRLAMISSRLSESFMTI
jgi:dipeptidyl aminopeptidase/acylaminoacyl peptidase